MTESDKSESKSERTPGELQAGREMLMEAAVLQHAKLCIDIAKAQGREPIDVLDDMHSYQVINYTFYFKVSNTLKQVMEMVNNAGN